MFRVLASADVLTASPPSPLSLLTPQSEYRKKVSHLNEIKKKGYMHDAIKKDNEKLDELGSSIEKDKKKLFFLQQPASQDSGAGGSAGDSMFSVVCVALCVATCLSVLALRMKNPRRVCVGQ